MAWNSTFFTKLCGQKPYVKNERVSTSVLARPSKCDLDMRLVVHEYHEHIQGCANGRDAALGRYVASCQGVMPHNMVVFFIVTMYLYFLNG